MKLKQLFCAAAVAATSSAAIADHIWSNNHWATTNNVVNLTVIDNTTSDWKNSFLTSIDEWNKSSHINQTVVAGSSK